jgi:hypothetical protein
MLNMTSARPRRVVVALAALTAVLASSTSASAERELFFEETASAFWAVPHECADGSTVQGTLLVLSTRDFEAPDTEDPDPTARVQFWAVCPDGTSFSWAAPTAPWWVPPRLSLAIPEPAACDALEVLGARHGRQAH